MYLSQISKLDQDKDQERIFRYLVAMEENMLAWEDALELIRERIFSSINQNFETDLVRPDLGKICKVAYSGKVDFSGVSNIIAFSGCVTGIYRIPLSKNSKQILAVTKNVQVDSFAAKYVDVRVYDYDELWDKHTQVGMKSSRNI